MYEYTLMLDKMSRRPYLVEEKEVDYPSVRKMNDPGLIVKMMTSVYRMPELAEEAVYMLTMNSKCDVTGVFMIGKGDAQTCICSVRDMFTRAMLAGATGIVIVHNHPSGYPAPSDIDRALTKRTATVGELMQVQLLDSIIIGRDTFVSMMLTEPETIKPIKILDEL